MKVLDCTIRDGGYVNNWFFSKDNVVQCYEACKEAKVDYFELGFRRKLDSSTKYGDWYYTTEELINNAFLNVNTSETKLAVMAQIGTVTVQDFVPSNKSKIKLVRVLWAYHSLNKNDNQLNIQQLKEGIILLKGLHDLGYETCFNIGRIDNVSLSQLETICSLLSETNISYFYLADTYGTLTLSKIQNLLPDLKCLITKYLPNTEIGFHAHNNLDNATSKSVFVKDYGVSIVDGTFHGYGRGSGNAKLELLVEEFKKGNIVDVLTFIENNLISYKSNKNSYNSVYFLTSKYNMHVNYGIHIIDHVKKFDIQTINNILCKICEEKKEKFFDKSIIDSYLQTV